MPALSKKSNGLEPALEALDRAALERIFGAEGHLAKLMKAQKRGFEARPEQLEMASAVAKAAREGQHLLVEAGTGTGKSYAYLVPLILWALEKKKRVLIATGTKALQQQLVERDLPFLATLFKKQLGQDFKFALCLGAGNYICPRRLAKAQVGGLFATPQEAEQLQKIHAFAERTSSGRNLDLHFEPSPGVWAQVNREGDLCMGRACQLYDDSFYFKARREQEKAQILVANHHLLFAHIAAGGNSGGVLPSFEALVIDEAHHAEDVAASYLGLEISNLGAAKLIEMIANRKSGRTLISGTKWTQTEELETSLTAAAGEARTAVGQFFENLQLAVRFEPNRSSSVRMRRANLLENCLKEPLETLERILREAKKVAESNSADDLTRELEGFATRCAEMRKTASALVSHERENYVYWAQSVPRPADGFNAKPRAPRLSVHGAPIEVARELRQNVFEQFQPTILTSATLTTGGKFDFLIERLGLGLDLEAQPDEPVGEMKSEAEVYEERRAKFVERKNGISVSRSSIKTKAISIDSLLDPSQQQPENNREDPVQKRNYAENNRQHSENKWVKPENNRDKAENNRDKAENKRDDPENKRGNAENKRDAAENNRVGPENNRVDAENKRENSPQKSEITTLTLGSPFDYQKNALVYLAKDLPDPANVSVWEDAAIKRAAEVVKRTEGRAFILCTSYRLVDSTARFLEKVMPKSIRILRQGEGARGKLLADFRSDTHSVLVGTTSFWQGVDVPGESLSCVVIMKLPFAVPDEPMTQARIEAIRLRGGDPFGSLQVPQAVMMFRQGFGRLIRTGNDRGVVAILDPRVSSKPYGKTFLDSLPDCERTDELERLSLFMSGV